MSALMNEIFPNTIKRSDDESFGCLGGDDDEGQGKAQTFFGSFSSWWLLDVTST